MFGKMGLHIIKFPSGRFGFVGDIPYCLGKEVKATRSDIMGGRAYNTIEELKTIRFPVFETREEARVFALEKGCVLDG